MAINVSYAPALAECISETVLDPDLCESLSGPGTMQVDEIDSELGSNVTSFLRFDLDDALVGAQILEVRLRVTATQDSGALASESGQVWRTAPFTLQDLSTTYPTLEALLALELGPVEQGSVIEWTLPTDAIQPEQSNYFAIFPTSSDGTIYWNAIGLAPPVLEIEAQM